jgi:hypothetical protein
MEKKSWEDYRNKSREDWRKRMERDVKGLEKVIIEHCRKRRYD